MTRSGAKFITETVWGETFMKVAGRLEPMGSGVGAASLGSFRGRISRAYGSSEKVTGCRRTAKWGCGVTEVIVSSSKTS